HKMFHALIPDETDRFVTLDCYEPVGYMSSRILEANVQCDERQRSTARQGGDSPATNSSRWQPICSTATASTRLAWKRSSKKRESQRSAFTGVLHPRMIWSSPILKNARTSSCGIGTTHSTGIAITRVRSFAPS